MLQVGHLCVVDGTFVHYGLACFSLTDGTFFLCN